MGPVALVALEEVLNVPYLVVANHHEAAGLVRRAKVVDVGQCGQRGLLLADDLTFSARQTSVGEELRLDVAVAGKAEASVSAGEVDVAPVDADAVAGLGEDGLLDGACLEVLCAVLKHAVRDGGLLNLVDSHLRCGGKIELRGVLLPVGGAHLVRDVVDGSGQQVVVVDDVGGSEDNVQFHGAAGEGIVGVAGQHVDALLLGRHDFVVPLGDVAEDAEVDQCAACLVVAMYGKDVLPGPEQTGFLAVQADNDAVHIVHDAGGSFLAVDVDVAGIVVREDEVEVAFELTGSQLHGAAHPDVVVLFRPGRADVVVVVRTEGALAALPAGIVEVGLHPVLRGLRARVPGFPFGLVSHWDDALHEGPLCAAHPSIGRAVHAEQALQGLLVASPVACAAVGELVVGAPDGEIGVADHQWNTWQTQVGLLVGFEELGSLCPARQGDCCKGNQGNNLFHR